jgi:hypothetical protein
MYMYVFGLYLYLTVYNNQSHNGNVEKTSQLAEKWMKNEAFNEPLVRMAVLAHVI